MKRKHYIVIGVLSILIVTNPSITAFKAFKGYESYSGLRRPINIFVLSEYKAHRHRYIGILGNFIDIGYADTAIWKAPITDTIIDISKKDSSFSPPLPKGFKKIDTNKDPLHILSKN
jgi:hypothetical protein